ncbi:MAG: uroporphyrinogen-III C-methyltransferase [Myxococcota bacterium]
MSPALFPLFLKLAGKRVLLVGGGRVAAAKLPALLEAGAAVHVVAPKVRAELLGSGVPIEHRAFVPEDVDGAWLVVAAAPGEVNREVARAAEARGVFVNAVDDAAVGSAYTGGVLRRDGVTVAIGTQGSAPALAGLLRQGLDALLPKELGAWVELAVTLRRRQRAQGVPMEERRPQLLLTLNSLYPHSSLSRWERVRVREPGFVSLVGAGPGDPGLLTLQAVRALERADLILYDALVSPEVLALAVRAKRFFVGKRARQKSVKQETIHRLMVRAARRGEHVVRLKCGDPFVLGRGGEEVLALLEAGVPFEVVPGVSSAVAAPALAGIPLTHRGLSSSFVVLSGHAEASYGPVLDSLLPGSMTVVVLMGLAHRSEIAARLVRRGWPPNTPAAVCLAASTERSVTWVGTLGELSPLTPAVSQREREGEPGVLVIGEVVALAQATRLPFAQGAVHGRGG